MARQMLRLRILAKWCLTTKDSSITEHRSNVSAAVALRCIRLELMTAYESIFDCLNHLGWMLSNPVEMRCLWWWHRKRGYREINEQWLDPRVGSEVCVQCSREQSQNFGWDNSLISLKIYLLLSEPIGSRTPEAMGMCENEPRMFVTNYLKSSEGEVELSYYTCCSYDACYGVKPFSSCYHDHTTYRKWSRCRRLAVNVWTDFYKKCWKLEFRTKMTSLTNFTQSAFQKTRFSSTL